MSSKTFRKQKNNTKQRTNKTQKNQKNQKINIFRLRNEFYTRKRRGGLFGLSLPVISLRSKPQAQYSLNTQVSCNNDCNNVAQNLLISKSKECDAFKSSLKDECTTRGNMSVLASKRACERLNASPACQGRKNKQQN